MSKILFAAILKQDRELTKFQIDCLWLKANNACLPVDILLLLKPHIHLFPVVRRQYIKLGLIENMTRKDQVKDAILALLVGGGLYTCDFIDRIPANPKLVVNCLNELCAMERIKFSFCQIKKSRFYTGERNYILIQKSILRVFQKGKAIDESSILNELRGIKRCAIKHNINDLLRNGRIHCQQGKYIITC